MDRTAENILVVVGSEQSESLCHRKGKGSLAMSFSQGVGGPNLTRNRVRERESG